MVALWILETPPAVITRYRVKDASGNKITTSSTLKVQNTALCDEGWYTCFANNELGNTTVNLLVLVGELNNWLWNRAAYFFSAIMRELSPSKGKM